MKKCYENKIMLILIIFIKYFILFFIDGSIYLILELLFRGYSHISMFILGGICGVLVGGLNNWYTWDMSLIKQMILSGFIITALEFCTGYIVNIRLGLNVWDYSDLPFNISGQVCLYFSLAWTGLSLVAILLDDWLRYLLFNEEYKKYRLF